MKRFYLFLLFLIPVVSLGFTTGNPLSADNAFQLSATAKDNQTILLTWTIAPDHFLYRQHFSFHVIKPAKTTIGEPLYPIDVIPLKTALGVKEVYNQSLTIPIPITESHDKYIVLQAQYQGCSSAGYCYPPITKIMSIDLTSHFMQPIKPLNIDVAPITEPEDFSKTIDNPINKLLGTHNMIWIIIGFIGFGLLLSFTPCVLPMIPILSSMIIGKKKMTHLHAFLISLSYVLGMAITYAAAGILFGLLGSSVQIDFQKPWIILLFSLIFIAMALSLFGLFNLQLPERLQNKISKISHHQKRGTYIGALVMGCLSTLILSPCVTPPLVAALGFISQSGNAAVGGIALFAMGIGMGAPLLLIGAMGPKILPHTGPWMNAIKIGMGIMLLIVAFTMALRVVPDMIGFKTIDAQFQSVKSVEDVDRAIQAAHKPVMLDFYASWCISCKELEIDTFQNPAVKKALAQFLVLRVDISQNNVEDQRLLQHFNVVGPPALLFFKGGKEIPKLRLVGFVPADKLLAQLNKMLNDA